MITLYRAPYSTNVERIALALAFKGLEARSVEISYADRSVVERVSGQGLVPVIEDGDGTVVADSPSILRHLEARHPHPPLYPSDPARRAEAEVFVDWFNHVWKPAPNLIDAELQEPEPDREKVARLGEELVAALDRFEELLAGRDHLLGDGFSVADCVAFPFLKYHAIDVAPDDDDSFHRVLQDFQRPAGRTYPRLERWIRRVDRRPRA